MAICIGSIAYYHATLTGGLEESGHYLPEFINSWFVTVMERPGIVELKFGTDDPKENLAEQGVSYSVRYKANRLAFLEYQFDGAAEYFVTISGGDSWCDQYCCVQTTIDTAETI
jgi:hypothetical protein